MKFLELYQKMLLAFCNFEVTVSYTYGLKCPKVLQILLLPIFIAFTSLVLLAIVILFILYAILIRIMGIATFNELWQVIKGSFAED